MIGSDVYFAPVSENEAVESIQEKVVRLYDAAGIGDCIQENDLVGLKIHFGEKGNTTHICPDYVKPVVDLVKLRKGNPFWIDTNTLYNGQRAVTPNHLRVAEEHGFTIERTGAPVVIIGGLTGNDACLLPVKGKYYEEVSVALDLERINSLVILSHATGHMVSGFGGALKNVGMGLSSRRGKLDQHSDVKPFVREDKCRGCTVCLNWCPVQAIAMHDKKAGIDGELCIGCGECLAACRYKAIGFNWSATSQVLQEKMVEYTSGILRSKAGRFGLMNFLINVTKDCDCLGTPNEILAPAIGILASKDPVAIDAASLDLFRKHCGKTLCESSYPHLDSEHQIKHAVELGLGNREYRLVEIA
ncbi:MAG TPA: DUF362 domain-containing protein [bacterium]|nr:DUF362 domain-containing protein [bacterium]